MGNYYVYIMASKSRRLYTGVTNNLERRVSEHKLGVGGRFTAKYKTKMLVYYELHSTARNAIAQEKRIKGCTRAKKIALIEEENPDWKDLSADWEL